MNVLITGGAGYIGSTIASACLDAGHQVVILDDLSAGRREFTEGRTFYEGDIADEALLDKIFGERESSNWGNDASSETVNTWAETWLKEHKVPMRKLSCQLYQRKQCCAFVA